LEEFYRSFFQSFPNRDWAWFYWRFLPTATESLQRTDPVIVTAPGSSTETGGGGFTPGWFCGCGKPNPNISDRDIFILHLTSVEASLLSERTVCEVQPGHLGLLQQLQPTPGHRPENVERVVFSFIIQKQLVLTLELHMWLSPAWTLNSVPSVCRSVSQLCSGAAEIWTRFRMELKNFGLVADYHFFGPRR
ncbi:hypothetical protein GOODEAATRI_010126, partial [Goodea atripinnis]